ncbi:MAG: hypothetical protein R2791_06280 [Saprospiraceae bacterium]
MYHALKSCFRDDQQFRLFGMLVLASVCCALLVVGRMYDPRGVAAAGTGLCATCSAAGDHLYFLLWNLFWPGAVFAGVTPGG